jgi:hypothetical protein
LFGIVVDCYCRWCCSRNPLNTRVNETEGIYIISKILQNENCEIKARRMVIMVDGGILLDF